MKKVLVVQRYYTHYRKSLFNYIESRGEYLFDVLSLGERDTIEGRNHVFSSNKLFRYKNYDIQYSKTLIKYIKKNYQAYDYIILEGTTNIANNIPICRFLRKQGYPYIIWDAGRRRNASMSLLRKIAQKPLFNIWKNAGAIIAYSSFAKKYFCDIGIDREHIFVCQNTLVVEAFDEQISRYSREQIEQTRSKFTSKNGKIILYVGAIESRKRIKDLIDAFEIVQKKTNNVSLVIIGGGSQLDEIKRYASRNNNIFVLGQIITGVIEYFLACDLFILPSEGGLALNQAMICGKPVIASSADGTEFDLIHEGENGHLFSEANITELSDQILEVLEDDNERITMGYNSRRIIEETVNEKTFYECFRKCLNDVELGGKTR